jgi:hypothetical protein
MKTKLIRTVALAATCALSTLFCNNPNGGNGSQTPNSLVAGVVFTSSGAPAANVRVRFYPVGYNPHTGSFGKTTAAVAADSLTVTTDASGRYNAPLDTGTYTIWDSGAAGLAYRDSIKITKGDTARSTDTLRAPGTLTGVVQMQGADEPRTVFIIFLGTNAVSLPLDTVGNFLITNLPQGSYHVRFLTTTPNYKVLDTSLSVTAGKIDTLASPIVMQYTGIPVPAGLKIQYDSMKEIVTLVWNRPTTGSPIKGYQVLRKNAAYNVLPAAINAQIVTDTTYKDSTGVQDSSYEYYVAAVDTGNEVGGMGGGVEVKIASKLNIIDSVFSPLINSSQTHGFNIGPDSSIYIAAAGLSNFIRVLSKNGDSIGAIGERIFGEVDDIAFDSKGNIYGADQNKNSIFKFSKSGQLLSTWPVNSPTAITLLLRQLNMVKPHI